MTSNVETLSMSWCHMPQMNKGHVLMKVIVINAWLYSAHMNLTSQFFYNHIGKMATWAYASHWLLDIWKFIQWDPDLYAEGISSQIWVGQVPFVPFIWVTKLHSDRPFFPNEQFRLTLCWHCWGMAKIKQYNPGVFLPHISYLITLDSLRPSDAYMHQ